jgi:hypothetical protein
MVMGPAVYPGLQSQVIALNMHRTLNVVASACYLPCMSCKHALLVAVEHVKSLLLLLLLLLWSAHAEFGWTTVGC